MQRDRAGDNTAEMSCLLMRLLAVIRGVSRTKWGEFKCLRGQMRYKLSVHLDRGIKGELGILVIS